MYVGTTKDGGLLMADGPHKPTAFELVTDADFDFGKKLEQVKKYKQEYKDARVIIPEEYKEDYAQLFGIDNITVHTWKGTRLWKCKKCGNITEVKDSSMQPERCSSNSCTNTLYLIGLKDVQFK
jgi:ABC-type ATPase with predicted acetyltransferase domain